MGSDQSQEQHSSEVQNEADGGEKSGVEQFTEPPNASNNERLVDYFPKALIFIVKLFGLTDPNFKHRYKVWIVLFLGTPIVWPFWLIRLVVGLKPNVLELIPIAEIAWTIWGFTAVDIYESMRKYMSRDVSFLLGDHVNVTRLRRRINFVVFLGIIYAFAFAVIVPVVIALYWQQMSLVDRIFAPLRIIGGVMTCLLYYGIFLGGI